MLDTVDSKVLVAITSLIAVSLASLLAGLGYVFKIRSERLKTKRHVLFHLLELRFQLVSTKVNPQKFADEYFSYCQHYFEQKGITNKKAFPAELDSSIRSHLTGIFESIKPDISPQFLTSFERALNELSITDPVLAYSLRGRERLNQVINYQDGYVNNLKNSAFLANAPSIKNLVPEDIDNLHSDTSLTIIEEINKDIRLISWYCGILTWFKCRKILKHTVEPQDAFNKIGLEALFDQLFAKYADLVKQ